MMLQRSPVGAYENSMMTWDTFRSKSVSRLEASSFTEAVLVSGLLCDHSASRGSEFALTKNDGWQTGTLGLESLICFELPARPFEKGMNKKLKIRSHGLASTRFRGGINHVTWAGEAAAIFSQGCEFGADVEACAPDISLSAPPLPSA